MLVLCIALCSCSKNENDVKPESDTPISDKNESKITIACTQDVQVLVSDGLNTAGIDTVKLIDAGNEFISRGFMLDVASDRIPDILITGDIRQFINYAELGYFFPVAYDGIKDAAPCAYSKMMETSVYDKLCTWNKKHNYGIILRTDYADMQICINNNLIDDFVSVRKLLTRNKPDSRFSLIDLPFRSPIGALLTYCLKEKEIPTVFICPVNNPFPGYIHRILPYLRKISDKCIVKN